MTTTRLKSIDRLEELLRSRTDLRVALEQGIANAHLAEVGDMNDFYSFLRKMLTAIPTPSDLGSASEQFHFLVSQAPEDRLRRDAAFIEWMVAFAKEHGEYMDSSESAEELKRFTRDASYRIDDYYVGASGWLTFNQFFTRSVKPGRRPVAEPCNERVIVSPTDSVYLGCWPVHERGSVLIKGVEYSIDDLLAGSPYKHAFAGGLFAHCYLDSADYHRFHVPVGGRILESRVISGNVLVNVRRKADGSLEAIDDVGFQFRQTRGVFVIESALGPVAVLPIGMGHVSSVNLTAEVGVILRKGDEFGFFAYGGSDIILLFAAGRAVLTATPGRHYLQGERIGEEGR